MDVSIFLARLLGPYFFILGLVLLFHREAIRKVALEIVQSPALLFMAGACRLFLGLVLLGIHNFWIQGWEAVITVLAWLLVLKGAFTLLFPEAITGMAKPWLKKAWYFLVAGLILLLLGTFLLYEGYMLVY